MEINLIIEFIFAMYFLYMVFLYKKNDGTKFHRIGKYNQGVIMIKCKITIRTRKDSNPRPSDP